MTGPRTDHSEEIAKLDAVEAELRAEDAQNAGTSAEAAASGTSTDPNDRGAPAPAAGDAGAPAGSEGSAATVDVHTSTAPGIIADGGQTPSTPAPGNSQVNSDSVGGVAPAATDTGAAPADTGAAAAEEGSASDPTDAVITQARDDVAAIRDRVRAQAHSNRNAATVLNTLDSALALINEAINTPA